MAAHRKRIIAAFKGESDPLEPMNRLATAVDRAIGQLLEDDPPEGLCVAATGGYGRRQLSPGSDVDLSLLLAAEDDPALDRRAKTFYSRLIVGLQQTAGLQIGYSFRSLNDLESLEELDAKTRCGLIDARCVAGDSRLFDRFLTEFWERADRGRMVYERYDEFMSRRARFVGGSMRVEPDLKLSPGGLRDAHTVRWVSTLVGNPLIATEDSGRLAAGEAVLYRYRWALHRMRRDGKDDLPRSRQEDLAVAMGVVQEGKPDVAELMSALLGAMRTVQNISEEAIDRAINGRLTVEGFEVERGTILQIPGNRSLEALSLTQRYPINCVRPEGPLRLTQAAIGRAMAKILAERGKVGLALRTAVRFDLLRFMLPNLDRCLSFVPPDPSHEFTVGEHTLRTVERLDEYWNSDDSPFRNALQEIESPETLYLAAALHDVGKLDYSAPHSISGAKIAQRATKAWQWPKDQAKDVVFLIRNHLEMARTARQHDLSLPSTIAQFCRLAKTPERLRMLYLLTCADTSSVGPGVWTPVFAEFLRELYIRAMNRLEGDSGTPDEDLARRRLLRELSKRPIPQRQIDEHAKRMPASYLLSHTPEQISLHIVYVERAMKGEPQFDWKVSENGAWTELTICAQDDPQPGLLAKIAGVLYACDVGVHSARVFTRKPGIAIDTLWIDYRDKPLSVQRCEMVQRELTSVLLGQTELASVLKRHRREMNAQPQIIKAEGRNERGLTFIELHYPIGLDALYQGASAMARQRWNIHSARVGSWAGRAVTSFYVTDVHGRKVSEADLERFLKKARA